MALGTTDNQILTIIPGCGFRGFPAPVTSHWIGLDWIAPVLEICSSVIRVAECL